MTRVSGLTPIPPSGIGPEGAFPTGRWERRVKKRRLALHLLQADLAKRCGVHWGSIQNWERGITEPAIRHLPRIIDFLGYDPVPQPEALPARIAWARRRLGMTQKDLAVAIQTDEVTIWRWETGRSNPPDNVLPELKAKLGGMQSPCT